MASPRPSGPGKGALFSQLQAQFAAEVARPAELAAGSLGTSGAEGLAAVELAITGRDEQTGRLVTWRTCWASVPRLGQGQGIRPTSLPTGTRTWTRCWARSPSCVCDQLFVGRVSRSFRPLQRPVSCRKSSKNPATRNVLVLGSGLVRGWRGQSSECSGQPGGLGLRLPRDGRPWARHR